MATRKAQFTIEEAPFTMNASLYPRPNLLLSGLVFQTPQDSYCIINDKIVKVGDSIDGARLNRVTPNEAVLDFHGEKIVLTVAS